jgi:hypothetical protein
MSGDFHAGGKATAHAVATTLGRTSYVEAGSGPAALFVHGVLLNSHLWRHQLGGLADLRRCTSLRRMHRRSCPIGWPASFQKPSRPPKYQVQESFSPTSGRTASSSGCVNTRSRNARPNGSAVEPDDRTIKWHKEITMTETTAGGSHRSAGQSSKALQRTFTPRLATDNLNLALNRSASDRSRPQRFGLQARSAL